MLFVAWQGAIAQVAAWAGVPGPLLVAPVVRQISLNAVDLMQQEDLISMTLHSADILALSLHAQLAAYRRQLQTNMLSMCNNMNKEDEG